MPWFLRETIQRGTDDGKQYLRLYERLIGAASSPRVFDASAVQAVQTDMCSGAVSS